MFNTVYSALYRDYAHLDLFSNHAHTISDPGEMVDTDSILILHGGEDISPSLYGQSPNHYTGASSSRSYRDWETDRKSTRLNSSHSRASRMPSSA